MKITGTISGSISGGINTNPVDITIHFNGIGGDPWVVTNAIDALQTAVSGLATNKAEKNSVYTKSEINAQLAGKANVNGDSNVNFAAADLQVGNMTLHGDTPTLSISAPSLGTVYLNVAGGGTIAKKSDIPDISVKADKNGSRTEPFETNMLSLWESNFGYVDLFGGTASSGNQPRLRIESTENGDYGIDIDLPLASKNAKVATSEDVSGINSRVNALETSIPTAIWVQMCVGLGATYDESTGLFSLNGLSDITLSEMKTIYRCTHAYRPCYDMASMLSPKYTATGTSIKFRTNFCNSRMLYLGADDAVNMNYFAYGNSLLEVCVLYRGNLASERLRPRLFQNVFNGCTRLREIVGGISLALITNRGILGNAFSGCTALEEVRLLYLAAPAVGSYASISFADSPVLSMESIAYMINNADTAEGIVIQLHNTAYNNAKQSAAVANALAAKTNVTLINADWTYKWCDNTEYHNTGSDVWERYATCLVNSLDGSVVWTQIGPINSGGEQQGSQIG